MRAGVGNKIPEMRKIIGHPRVQEAIFHPFAFAVFPILSLYVKNTGKGFLLEAIGTAIGVFILAGLLWLLVSPFVKNRDKSAIVVSIFFVLFFSYGHAISACSAVLERLHLLDKARFLVEGRSSLLLWLAIWIGIFVVALFFVARSARDLRPLTKLLNIVALTLIVTVGVNFAASGMNVFLPPRVRAYVDQVVARFGSKKTGADLGEFKVFLPVVTGGNYDKAGSEADVGAFIDSWQRDISSQNASQTPGMTLGYSPDIYYIILDMYARADVLEGIYHLDNSEFLSYLAEKGFYVADKSRSNYPHTIHSLSSALNFMYLDHVPDQIGQGSKNFGPLMAMIKNNKVFRHLRNFGYSILAFSSGYEITEIKDADIYMAPPGWHPSQFQNTLIDITPLAIFQRTQDDFYRERILYIFDHLVDATRIDSPAFVFAHISAPHPPYIFGANGEPVQSRPERDYEYDEYVAAYTNQLTFINKRLQSAIEEILSQSPEPPIIILQADHGPNSGIYVSEPNRYFPERMSIFNAYYFPDQNYETLYEDITPVNTFRIVLNGYFGADYDLLEDRSYFSTWERPYSFTDVTDKVLSGY